MTDLAKLVVRLEAENSKLLSKLDTTNRKLTAFQRRSTSAVNVVKAGFIGLASALSVDLFATALKSSIEFADNIGKTADKVGIATDYLQEMRFAAERSGGTISGMDKSLQRFSRRVGEAAQGTGELKDTLKQYGIELRNSDGTLRSIEDILSDYADAMAGASDEQEQLRMAVKAFDQEGAFMVNVLRGGADSLKDMRDMAKSTGAVMDETLIRRSEVIADRWGELTTVIGVRFKSALITAADATLNFFGVYNDLATVTDALAEAENRLAKATERAAKANGRNLKAALNSRNEAAKDVARLKEQQEEFKKLEERVNALKASGVSGPRLDFFKKSEADAKKLLEAEQKAAAERMQWEETAHIESYENYVASLERKALALEEHSLDAVSQEELRYERELQLLEEAQLRGIEIKGEYWDLEAELLEEHLEKMEAIQARQQSREYNLWQSGWQGKARVMGGILGDMSTLMYTENRKMFEIGKTAATAQAIVDTIAAAQAAYRAMAGIPVVGPALAAAAAAAALAAGYARVRAIQSQTFQGGGGGATSGGGGSVVSGSTTLSPTATVQELPRTEQTEKPVVQIHIENITGSISQFKDEITDIVNTAIEQTDTIVFS